MSAPFRPPGTPPGGESGAALANYLNRIRRLEASVAAGAGLEQGYSTAIDLPVLAGKYQNNNFQSNGYLTWVIDSTYPNNGYMQQAAGNGGYVAWPINFGPQGSYWMPIPVMDQGPDRPKIRLEFAVAPYEDDGFSWGFPPGGMFMSYDDCNVNGYFHTLEPTRFDLYQAVADPYPGNSQIFKPFQIHGADNEVGTGFFGAYDNLWSGGSGPHWVRLRVDGKHASSSGYNWRISEFKFLRLGNDLTL